MDISSPWPLMVTKIGKFCDYIVGRAQVTRTGEKQTWIEHKPHIFSVFCISSARQGFDRQHWACWVFAFVVGVFDGEVGVIRLPFCLDPIVTWVYRVRLTEDGRNLMALFCLFLFGGAECLPCLFSHSYFFHLFVRRGNRRIRLGTSPLLRD